jgi:tripartite-type tricarboxylate transporter receptor subunit TctC
MLASLPSLLSPLAPSAAPATGIPAASRRTLSLVVPYPAGGSADALARAMQPTLARQLGETVVVENVSGASGTLGVQRVVSAPADGQTLLIGSPNEVILAPLALTSARYRPEDLQYLATITVAPLVLMARRDLPTSSLDELVALAERQRARPLTFGSVGHGSMYHLVAEYLGKIAQVPLVHIPYKGTTPLVQDLVGQQVDFAVLPNVGIPTEMLQAGRLRAVAVLDARRMTSLPDTPAVSESALAARERLQFSVWGAVLLRRGVLSDRVDQLHRALREAIASEEVARTLSSSGSAAAPAVSLRQSSTFYDQEIIRFRNWAQAIDLRKL